MMFRRISLIASLLFFLLGTNVFANSNPVISSKNVITSHTTINKVSNKSMKAVPTSTTEIKKAEPTFMNYVVPATVCLFIIIIIGGYWFILRKKISAR